MSRHIVGIGILAYERPKYLQEILRALACQDGAETFPIAILDNGSSQPLIDSIAREAELIRGPLAIIREARNALTPERFAALIDAVDADFVLLPGDDDVPLANYVSTAQMLAGSQPSITLISSGMRQIDAKGRLLATENPAPAFPSAPIALGNLISQASYCMPVTGFRKSAIDFSSIPMTRTAFDWWLWIQCWLGGVAATSDLRTLKYRQHGGQEQRLYGSQAFRNDAARMLLDVIRSSRFEDVIAGWTEAEQISFTQTVLNSSGPNSGDSRWGPIIQMSLADQLREYIPSESCVRLFAQASGHAGTPATEGVLRALAPDARLSVLPEETWSRVPIAIRWNARCPLADCWKNFLNIRTGLSAQFSVVVDCACELGQASDHRLLVRGERFDGSGSFRLELSARPSEREAGRLLDSLGRLTGRLHGFETHVTDEVMVLKAYRRFRLSRLGVLAEKMYRSVTRNHRSRSAARESDTYKPSSRA